MQKKKKLIKLVNAVPLKQRRDYLYIKNIVVPLVKSYGMKTIAILLWAVVYLSALSLFGWSINIKTLLGCVGLYFLVEEFKTYFLLLKKIGVKK